MRISTVVDQIQPAAAKSSQLPKLKIASSTKGKKACSPPRIRTGTGRPWLRHRGAAIGCWARRQDALIQEPVPSNPEEGCGHWPVRGAASRLLARHLSIHAFGQRPLALRSARILVLCWRWFVLAKTSLRACRYQDLLPWCPVDLMRCCIIDIAPRYQRACCGFSLPGSAPLQYPPQTAMAAPSDHLSCCFFWFEQGNLWRRQHPLLSRAIIVEYGI